jgi:Ras-related protein Rab-1A
VYDITNADSFEGIKVWYDSLMTRAKSDIHVTLVGNKNDLSDYETMDNEVARDWAEERNAGFVKTSAKLNENIEYVFWRIAEHVVGQGKQEKKKSFLLRQANE